MLGIAIFVENQERVGYDINLATKNWVADKLVVFAGSKTTEDILRTTLVRNDISIVNVNKPIIKSSDIPVAFNHCVDYMYDVIGVSSLIFISADEYLTQSGMQVCLDAYNSGKTLSMKTWATQMYAKLWVFDVCLSMSNRSNIVYYGGGTKPLSIHDIRHEDENLIVDLSYFDVATYIRKMKSHNYIWPDKYKIAIVDQFAKDKRGALHTAYSAMKAVNHGYALGEVESYALC